MSEKEKAKPALDGLGTRWVTNTSHPAPGSREKNKLRLPPPRVDHITSWCCTWASRRRRPWRGLQLALLSKMS